MLIRMLRCLVAGLYFLIVPLAVLSLLSINLAQAGFTQEPVPPVSSKESVQDLVSRLSPEQKQLFEEATGAFKAQRYSEALAGFKQMLSQLPGHPVLSKFASEAALNASDTRFALDTLKPVAAADPDDWQATALLTRACAESGDAACRDSGMAHLLDLHHRGVTPPRMQQYILEHVKVGENTLRILPSLEPWGIYKVYDLGQVSDKNGNVFMRVTLESTDADQIEFAKDHPKEAAAGIRRFSLDAYRETGLNSQGQRTQTHYTFRLLDGQPDYATVREEFIKIASGKAVPLSSRTNLIAP